MSLSPLKLQAETCPHLGLIDVRSLHTRQGDPFHSACHGSDSWINVPSREGSARSGSSKPDSLLSRHLWAPATAPEPRTSSVTLQTARDFISRLSYKHTLLHRSSADSHGNQNPDTRGRQAASEGTTLKPKRHRSWLKKRKGSRVKQGA